MFFLGYFFFIYYLNSKKQTALFLEMNTADLGKKCIYVFRKEILVSSRGKNLMFFPSQYKLFIGTFHTTR